MEENEWAADDAAWLLAYALRVAQPDVPVEAITARIDELSAALDAAGEPAHVVFGSPVELAAADAAELGTPEEALRAEFGAGWRSGLVLVGASLLVIALFVAVIVFRGIGWAGDVKLGLLMVLGGMLAFGGSVGAARALWAAGRVGWAGVAVVTGLAGFGGAVAYAATHQGAAPIARDVPTVLLALGALVPGLLVLAISRLFPRELRTTWTEAEWWNCLRGTLRMRGMPRERIRERERELRSALQSAPGDDGDAYLEYGHPAIFGRLLAAREPAACARRHAWASAVAVVVPLWVTIAGIPQNGWDVLHVAWVAGGAMLLAATIVLRWRSRPGEEQG